MSRVQFTETVTLPNGPGGTLVPVSGIVATPHVINPDGSDGGVVSAYASRTGSTAGVLTTNTNGSVAFYVESGDYDIYFADSQIPARIQPYVRSFTDINVDLTVLANSSQPSVGDTKFSFQTNDHGLRSDGGYNWLLVATDLLGNGRHVSATLYPQLWALLGNPPVDGNNFFLLPNISGRSLVIAGGATALTSLRNLKDMFGAEAVSLTDPNMNAPHQHLTRDTGHSHIDAGHTHADTGHSHVDSGHGHSDAGHFHGGSGGNATTPGDAYVSTRGGVGINNGIASGHSASSGEVGNNTTTIGVPMNNNVPFRTETNTGNGAANIQSGSANIQWSQARLTSNSANIQTGSANIQSDSSGGSTPHNNMPPGYALNLFVKS